MANLNRVVLAGRLTRDVELRYSQGGAPVAKTGIAINERWGQGEERKEKVHFVDLVAFGKTAELLDQYCKKGDPLLLEGRLSYSTWQTQAGETRHKLEVVIELLQFLKGKSDGARKPAAKAEEQPESVDYGDIPF